MTGAVVCVLDRIDAPDAAAFEAAFLAADGGIVIDLRRTTVTTPSGVALLARLLQLAKKRDIGVEFVSVTPSARRALVAAGIHHLARISE